MEITYSELRALLKHVLSPDQLDAHAWVSASFVAAFVADHPEVAQVSPGQQLLLAISHVYQQTLPTVPPKQGKRLDKSWLQFGLLGSLYFAPLELGWVQPKTLKDAWGNIDAVNLHYQFGDEQAAQSDADLAPYTIVADERDVAPISTLSDWHKRGLEALADQLQARENFVIAQQNSVAMAVTPNATVEPATTATPKEKRNTPTLGRIMKWAAALIALVLCFKLVMLVPALLRLRANAEAMRDLAPMLSVDAPIPTEITETALAIHADWNVVHSQTQNWLWVGPLLSWSPWAGGELSQLPELVTIADGFIQPIPALLEIGQEGQAALAAPNARQAALRLLAEQQDNLSQAAAHIATANAVLQDLDVSQLTPVLQNELTVERLALVDLGSDALQLAEHLPTLVGSGEEGAQSYLVLLQNEDEARATGGFITGVVTVTVSNGDFSTFNFEDSYAVDDPSKQYPLPPWQLQAYMNAGAWYLRDSNWSPDFPQVAQLAEHLFAQSRHSVDGVIALNMTTVQRLLVHLGAVEVEGETVTADQFQAFLYAQKDSIDGADRKDFLGPVAEALFAAVEAGDADVLRPLVQEALALLEEHQILMVLDHEAAAAVLADRRWDGHVRAGETDFLHIVESNLGFNKVNAATALSATYQVDLTTLEQPEATLTLTVNNDQGIETDCTQAQPFEYQADIYQDQIERCYWNYLRVYKHANDTLAASESTDPQADWQWFPERHRAGWQLLDDRLWAGDYAAADKFWLVPPENTTAYGMLQVVPSNAELDSTLAFTLNSSAVQATRDGYRYALELPRQVGTKTPLHISIDIQLPLGFRVIRSSHPVDSNNGVITIPLGALQSDQSVWVEFSS